MLKKVENQCLLSSKLGDGGFYLNGKTHYFLFVSKEKDYLMYKLNQLREAGIPMKDSPVGITKSGYKEGNFSFSFITRNSEKLSKVALMSVREAVDAMSLDGLIMFYLEDGTFHQRKHFMHIYCNTFSVEEAQYLIEKIYSLYPIKKCAIRWDKKKDGRKYPYLYIPVSVANVFKEDVKTFLEDNKIYSLLYKVGISPSTTIENTNSESTLE